MFGINFIKADPSTHIMQYRDGQVVRQGTGKAFFYYAPRCSLVAVPVNSKELPFVFSLQTKDFQSLTVQGQVTYQITQPELASARLNFAINTNSRYLSEDPQKVDERVSRAVQVMLRDLIECRDLKSALTCASELTGQLSNALDEYGPLAQLGIEINDIALTAITPNPETGKALEAEMREALLREADEAIYGRRLASIEQEKNVQESELETQRALQVKKQALEQQKLEAERARMQQKFQLQQEKIAAQVDDEQALQNLVALKAENERAEADSGAYAIRTKMEAFAGIDSERLKVLSLSNMGPEQLIAQAIENLTLGDNKIGQLNLAPDLLQSLLNQG